MSVPAEIARVGSEFGWDGAQIVVLWKLFGPSIAVWGSTLRSLNERYAARLLSITERGNAKLGDDADEDGEVSSRVVHKVLTDGIFTDDAVAHDYFGGLVAASRSKDGGDDSTIPMIQMLTRLSSAEIRLHYLIYRSIYEGLRGGWQFSNTSASHAAAVYLPMSSLEASLPSANLGSWVGTLVRESLVEQHYAVGPPRTLAIMVGSSSGAFYSISPNRWEPQEEGMIVRPAWTGFELAVRAEASRAPAQEFLYLDSVTAVPEANFDFRAAVFYAVPADDKELGRLRASAGYKQHDGPTGWALPDIDAASTEE